MSTEELLLRAAENSEMTNLTPLLANLREINAKQDLSPFAESLNLLWENFPEEPELDQAEFCLEAARLRLPDGPVFRQVLATAVKTVLPPYLSKAGVLRAIGLRDTAVQPGEILRRMDRLMAIKSGVAVFLFEASRWGTIGNLDPLNASVAVNLHDGGSLAVPLDKVISRGYFFKVSVAVEKMISPLKRVKLTSTEFRKICAENAVLHLSDGAVKSLAEKLMVPSVVSADKFDAWYAAESAPAPVQTAAVRGADRARSLKEMDLLLAQELAAKQNTVNDAQIAGFSGFFTNLKSDIAQREAKLLAEIIAKIADRIPEANWNDVVSPLKGKTPFWPVNANDGTLEALVVWGTLPVKLISRLALVTRKIFNEEYMAHLAVRLPLKSLNVCAEHLDKSLIDAVFVQPPLMTSDVILWAWKNRKQHPALDKLLKLENVVMALNSSRLPKEWGAAQRDLHTQLLDKEDFQKYMVGAASDDIPTLVGALAGAAIFTTGERQSLLVKLSRFSDKLRQHLKDGGASKVMTGSGAGQAPVPAVEEPIYTSLASHRMLVQELHDIINIHQPENREALATARAHGDFRENAEFDAAKERRNFLTRRRNELERDLAKVNALDFRTIKPGKFVDFGVTVELEIADGSHETYYYLGAWDGNPDKKYLSYKTKLGEVLRNHQAGDSVILPDNRKAKIASISALPESVLKDMD